MTNITVEVNRYIVTHFFEIVYIYTKDLFGVNRYIVPLFLLFFLMRRNESR